MEVLLSILLHIFLIPSPFPNEQLLLLVNFYLPRDDF